MVVDRRIRGPRVLVLSAGVGGGHLAAAEGLRDELEALAPQVEVTVRNGLGECGSPLRVVLERFTRWQLATAPRAYDCTYASFVRGGFGRSLAMRALYAAAAPTLRALIDREQPDVVVSTYPGITAPLGMLRARGLLATPVCAVITDMASLHFWAHSGVDLHLACYRESLSEIAEISGGAPVRVVKAPLQRDHWQARDRDALRAQLDLALEQRLAVVSGGGWGVGDLCGAVDAALQVPGLQVAVVCGQNHNAATTLARAYRGQARVKVLGFVIAMADLLGAADVLVHSTGGMTCLEAAAHGCPAIAYGFAYGHVRHNVGAMARHGLLVQAADARGLTCALRDTLNAAARPETRAPTEVWAGAAILELLSDAAACHDGSPAGATSAAVVLAS